MTERPLSVREATLDELPAVMGVLDGANLDVGAEGVRNRTPGEVLVAVAGADAPGDGRILGVLVLDGDEIEAVAVRRRRRSQGIGTALVQAAADRREALIAEFDDTARPFYEALGFEIERVGDGGSADGRFRGHLE